MSSYEIIKVPAAVLKQKSQIVDKVDDTIQKQLTDMVKTMYDGNGIGLAANQVGVANRVLVMDCSDATWSLGEDVGKGVRRVEVNRTSELPVDEAGAPDAELAPPVNKALMMVNPEVIWSSEHKSVYEEGCLSIPGYYADIVRPAEVRVKYLDFDGKEQELEADGLLSHCVQHEIDHLDGVLFIDYLSRLKRDMVIKRMKKIYGG